MSDPPPKSSTTKEASLWKATNRPLPEIVALLELPKPCPPVAVVLAFLMLPSSSDLT